MNSKSLIWASLAIGVSVVSFAGARAFTSKVEVGSPAPSFDVTDSKGGDVKLSDYRGKFVVMEWSNFGCPFVKKHYDSHNMQNLQKKYTAKGVVWLTVFSSAEGKQGYYTPDKLNEAAKERGVASTKLIPDPKGVLGHEFGATATPTMIVINPKGEVIYDGAIDDTPSSDKADLKTSKNYVAAALDAALAGKPVKVKTSRPYGCSVKYADQ